MDEFQQVLGGGVGAMAFYVLFTVVNIIKDLVANRGKTRTGTSVVPVGTTCIEHGAMCVHLETIRDDVGEIKGNVNRLVRDVAILQGRVK